MPAKRVSMRNVKEILRLRFDGGLSHRAIGRSVGISASTVGDLLSRAHAAGVVWPLPPELDEAALEARLYPPDPSGARVLVPPDWSYVHRELRRKGVTLMLLWQEYKAAHPEDGYQYSRFCDLYQDFEKKVDVVMRQVHRAGEKAFVDWSGDGPVITDPTTGEERRAELFLAVLGASNYTYAELDTRDHLRPTTPTTARPEHRPPTPPVLPSDGLPAGTGDMVDRDNDQDLAGRRRMTAEERAANRLVASFHEAGHVVVADALGIPWKWSAVPEYRFGHTRFDAPNDSPPIGSSEDLSALGWAGVVAEHLVLAQRSLGHPPRPEKLWLGASDSDKRNIADDRLAGLVDLRRSRRDT